MFWMKLNIYSQTSTVQSLKFGNGYKAISSHTLLSGDYIPMLRFKFHPLQWRHNGCNSEYCSFSTVVCFVVLVYCITKWSTCIWKCLCFRQKKLHFCHKTRTMHIKWTTQSWKIYSEYCSTFMAYCVVTSTDSIFSWNNNEYYEGHFNTYSMQIS